MTLFFRDYYGVYNRKEIRNMNDLGRLEHRVEILETRIEGFETLLGLQKQLIDNLNTRCKLLAESNEKLYSCVGKLMDVTNELTVEFFKEDK